MRKYLLGLIVVSLLTTPFFSADGSAMLWTTLYQQARSVKEKRDKMKQINEVATPEFEELILSILQEQATYPVSHDTREKRWYEEWVFYAALTAGNIHIKSAAPWLRKVYKNMDSIVIKGEILFSIGKTGNRDLIPWLNTELYTFNVKHRNGQWSHKEELIYGIIAAMKLFADESTFQNVFYAAIPNYSNKVRVLAEETLIVITDDPAPFCSEIIRTEQNIKIALEALRYAARSTSPDENKIATCVFAIREGLERVTEHNTSMEETRQQMMDEAVFNLGLLKAGDEKTISVIDIKWKADDDPSSLIINVEALQSIGSPAAIEMLHKYLNYFHEKKREGFGTGYGKADGNKLMIAIMRALGEIGSPHSIRELQKIAFSPTYESQIMKEAERALKRIEEKQGQ